MTDEQLKYLQDKSKKKFSDEADLLSQVEFFEAPPVIIKDVDPHEKYVVQCVRELILDEKQSLIHRIRSANGLLKQLNEYLLSVGEDRFMHFRREPVAAATPQVRKKRGHYKKKKRKPELDLSKVAAFAEKIIDTPPLKFEKVFPPIEKKVFISRPVIEDKPKEVIRPKPEYTNIPTPYGIATEMLKEQLKTG